MIKISCDNLLFQYMINYGLAGIVVYIFYRLMSNELRDLKKTINDLNETINKLIDRLSR